jgi:hypothetical protein
MGFIQNLGIGAAGQAASGLVDAGMGLLLEGHNDKRQLKQQQKLQDMQISGQQQMGIFNREQAMQMWHDTNYGPQMEELKKAGLNPALMYGMGGGGGTTTATPSGNVTGATAPQGKATQGEGMGMQLQLMQAQKENIEADTRNKEADTANKPIQGENIQAGTGLTKAQTMIAEAAAKVAGATIEEQIQTVTATMAQAQAQVQISETGVQVARGTQESNINLLKAQAAGQIITNELNKLIKKQVGAETELTQAQKHNVQQAITMWSQDNAQKWQQLSLEERKVKVAEALKDSNLEMQGIDEITNVIGQVFDGIFRHKPTITPNKVGFK